MQPTPCGPVVYECGCCEYPHIEAARVPKARWAQRWQAALGREPGCLQSRSPPTTHTLRRSHQPGLWAWWQGLRRRGKKEAATGFQISLLATV